MNLMAISMGANSEKSLEVNSRLPEIQPSGSSHIFMERHNTNHIVRNSPSSPRQKFERKRLTCRGEELWKSHNQPGGYQFLNSQPHDAQSSGHLNRLRDGKLMDRGYLSLAPPTEFGEGIPSTSSMRQKHGPRAGTIDIRNFHLHTPNKMCSAAAIHYTHDLLDKISERYTGPIWTFERLLPFVYFVVSCNTNGKFWETIKILTASTFRTFDQFSHMSNKSQIDQEKYARFVLWHTEVIYHIALSEPMIESSNVTLRLPGLSTLARFFLLIKGRGDASTDCKKMLGRHISETFEQDYQSGYPSGEGNWNMHGTIWENWNKKSNEIYKIGQGVDWPKTSNSQFEPVLLMNGDIEHDTIVKKSSSSSQFLKKWETDLHEMLQFISASQPSQLALSNISLKLICQGIHYFLKGELKSVTKDIDPHKANGYQVTLLAHFLHQDLNDQFFVKFWDYCFKLGKINPNE
ncbi:uncharacterized protein MELLADRAFT_59675 [Melampsora larici-populina 98AG31]|uniref:Uncharacterized protein n=1 Tax=Melampsora larici-populina (strain 98AG31 / pathotype 3-4-7) TaxID=747676 RepID=F4R8F1_MELLP|nr:uncharacterized protein MELLADRAFT_59675 [Melampsora larici-populina 98AG31]EGG11474.1 hypothetical protein MELLADRAFT_59675 [Melampsora larici-populina 98AG31]